MAIPETTTENLAMGHIHLSGKYWGIFRESELSSGTAEDSAAGHLRGLRDVC